MPVRHTILYGMSCLRIEVAAAKMIAASVDAIAKEQGESPVEDMRKAFEELAERENVLQPAMYGLPHVKGGRYHEPTRDLKKKKKAKRRQQRQSRRKR